MLLSDGISGGGGGGESWSSSSLGGHATRELPAGAPSDLQECLFFLYSLATWLEQGPRKSHVLMPQGHPGNSDSNEQEGRSF